jgi:hypothetical protein
MTIAPYSVLYKDQFDKLREFCCYGADAYEARLQATELVQWIQDSPESIVAIRRELEDFDW